MSLFIHPSSPSQVPSNNSDRQVAGFTNGDLRKCLDDIKLEREDMKVSKATGVAAGTGFGLFLVSIPIMVVFALSNPVGWVIGGVAAGASLTFVLAGLVAGAIAYKRTGINTANKVTKFVEANYDNVIALPQGNTVSKELLNEIISLKCDKENPFKISNLKFSKFNAAQRKEFLNNLTEDVAKNIFRDRDGFLQEDTEYGLMVSKLEKKPKLRGLVEIALVAQGEQIPEALLRIDFPRVFKRDSATERTNNDSVYSLVRKNKLDADRVTCLTRILALTGNSSVTLDNIQETPEIDSMIQFFGGKYSFVDLEDFEKLVKVAEDLKLNDLIDDLIVYIQQRPDLVDDPKELEAFIARHPRFGSNAIESRE